MRIHAIARHEFETQKRSNTIDNSSYNLYSYIFSELHTSALGALGRRFESCRPDSNNPNHRKESQPLFFITQNFDHLICGQIVFK